MASTTDIEEWLGENGPDDPVQLCALHEAFENLTDETIYSATESGGTIFVKGAIEPTTLVLPSAKSQNFFRQKLQDLKKDKSWGFDEEADFYRSVNSPNS